MFFKLIIVLTCMSIVNCAKKPKLAAEDEAVLGVFAEAMKHFNQSFGLTMTNFLSIIGNDAKTQDAIGYYFRNNPRARRLTDKINEGLFYDLVSAISRDCKVPLMDVAEYMSARIKKLAHNEDLSNGSSTDIVCSESSDNCSC